MDNTSRDAPVACCLGRSRLYRLEPRGLGSFLAESLTSYTLRLAAAHAVKPGVLIATELLPLFGKQYLSEGGKIDGTTWKRLVGINGTGSWATEWVRLLERLTMWPTLQPLTLLGWAGTVPARGLLRRERAWCPACLDEWRQSDAPLYEPLIWLIAPVTICPTHGVALETVCPNAQCGRMMLPLESGTVVGHCSKCGSWLGGKARYTHAPSPPNTGSDWHTYAASAVGEMLRLGYEPHSGKDTGAGIRVSLGEISQRAFGGDVRELARVVGISPRSAVDILGGQQTPTLPTLLQIGYRLSTTPAVLLGWQIGPTHYKVSGVSSPRRRNVQRRRAFPEERIRSVLQAALDADEGPGPRSMAQVARELVYDQSYLSRRFPVLCRAISRKYRGYLHAQKAEAHATLRAEIQAAVAAIHARGEYPTYRSVQAVLGDGRERLMRDRVAVDAWREALVLVGCGLGLPEGPGMPDAQDRKPALAA